MKKYLLLLLFIAGSMMAHAQADPDYPPPPAAAQNITAAEYFIDTDPGFGNGTAIAITPGVNVVNAAFNASTAGLSNGIHRIYIRTRNNEGRWSLVTIKDFLVDFDFTYGPAPAAIQNVSAAEYFIDTDPGIGNGTAIAVTPGTDINNVSAAIDVTGLSTGIHRLYIRTRSINGVWSITNLKDFLVDIDFPYGPAPAIPQNIIAAEYFIDTDPGFGNGTVITLTSGTDISALSFNANITGLGNGTHRIYIRTKNNEGSWSLANIKDFIIDSDFGYPPAPPAPQQVVAAEYFFDTDPGHGNGIPVAITAATDINDVAASVSTTLLTNGEHKFYLRTKNAEGQWSITNYTSLVKDPTSSWVIAPAAGYDYGNVAIGSSSNFNFKIKNTGNLPITLAQVSTDQAAFVPSFSSGTVIAASDSLTIPVNFHPTTVGAYSATLKITSTGVPDSVTTIITGTGYSPATPPVLHFVSADPYSGASGVNPAAGQTGNYTYKITYRSADNREPAAGFPKVGIDLNGDHDFDDAGEGMFPMNKEGSSTDYAAGVTYTYTANYSQYSNTMGYRFFANDALGNAATTNNATWYAGPVVTYELLDLKLFANDISFSKTNPLPGETFTVTANITNNSAFNATNVPVFFYRDTILIGSTTLPAANAFSTTTVSRTLSFDADGFYPIKVWVDPNHTLNENNVLNNYAIRPVIVGSPVLPGGIIANANTTVQNCPTQKLVFNGRADYFGTSVATAVAGAQVTINTGSATLTTYIDANGNFSLMMENPPCGNTLTYTVVVTDFTFTSNTYTGAQGITCNGPNTCSPPQIPGGGAAVSVATTPCSTVEGTTTTAQLKIKYRGRNPANMWGLWDKIWKDTVKVFNNGVLIQTFHSIDNPNFGSAGTFPGDEKIIPVNIPLGSVGPNNITVVATYVYNEFFENETPFYHGTFTPMTATASTTVFATPAQPDLTLVNFTQTSFRSFTFEDMNTECVDAGMHLVSIVDVTNPASPVLVKIDTIMSVAGKSSVPITVNMPTLAPGIHKFRVFTDTTALIGESNEDNNIWLVTLDVPAPDLTVFKVTPSTTDLPQGASVTFNAVIRNSGVETGPFTVRFLANGVPIGSDITVNSVGERGQVTVTSGAFTIPGPETDCPIDITVVADAGSTVSETAEGNNSLTIKSGTDIEPLTVGGEFGSIGNPVRVRVNTSKQFNAYIRNTGTRDVHNVTVRFMHNGTWIGNALVPLIKAGMDFPAVASFTHTFTTPGNTVVEVITDTANLFCEISEANNTGPFHIVVTDSKEDLVVLSQYISPSSLNPNAGQNITIVGTVKNIGNRVSPASNMRFYVDDIPLGTAVPFNSLQIGQDTTVQATVTYASDIAGVKVIKITVDEENAVSEEDELNNEATRTIIVGDAPDMVSAVAQPITFNPNGFNAGDTVAVAYQLRNNGTQAGTAWVRFKIFDMAGSLTAIDSIAFTLEPNSSTTVSRRLYFVVDPGYVVAEIANCSPMESNLLNNSDTLYFSTVVKMKSNITLNNLDMKAGAPQQLPGWIGGKIMLGDYDLVVNGNIVNFDTAHFIVTNGSGKLRIVNSNQQNIFPVGAGVYSPNFARIDNSGVPDNFSVRVLSYALRYGTHGDTIRAANVNRTWMIDEDIPGGSNATLELWWKAADELPGFDRTVSRVAHYTTNWLLSDPGNASVDAQGIFSRANAGYTGFSPFTVTSGGTVFVPLQFISFTATSSGKDVLLKWVTEAEVNTSHFEVEFSADGNVFRSIGKVASMNTAGEHRYAFTHIAPPGSLLYYRIRQVDLDGEFEYSKIVLVKLQTSIDLTLAPNPAQTFIQLRHADLGRLREIRIIGTDGKTVQRLAQNLRNTIDIQFLKNGMYYLQVFGKDGSIATLPFVKQ